MMTMITIRVGWLKVQGRPIMRNCSTHVPLFYHHEDHDVDDNDDDGNFNAMCVQKRVQTKKETFAARIFPSRKWVSGSVLQTCAT